MTDMNIQDAYNEWSDIYDSNINLTRDLDSTVTRNLLADRRFDSILELGCGQARTQCSSRKLEGMSMHWVSQRG
jgi:hypothetical protein